MGTIVRAQQPLADADILARHFTACREWSVLRAQSAEAEAADDDLVAAILGEAARVGMQYLEPLNGAEDSQAPALADGRVRLGAQHRAAWSAYIEGGWLGLDMPEAIGGQGLPLALAVAVQELFDRNCPAFGMLAVPIRSAVRLIQAYGSAEIRAEWLPHLARGDWGATICISEVEAGSDVMRARTRAESAGDGLWRVTGEKQWISFGDHDAVDRIGHCVLARTAGAKGLSLLLVPSTWDGERNGVVARRLEEKLGLHLSPTCALGFEGAKGILLGEEGRGLAQMFVMITNMRLSVASMGLGIAAGALDVAWSYAAERRQGGRGEIPLPITAHADVQRQVMEMLARVETLRGLVYRTAMLADIGRLDGDMAGAARAKVEWFLPIIKTMGGEISFSVASDAIQVLGGAGYTRDWPVEQSLRDARVLTVFEGTTGIQALDLLHRRLLKDRGETMRIVLSDARALLAGCDAEVATQAAGAFDTLEQVGGELVARSTAGTDVDAGATAFLFLAAEAALTAVAAELSAIPPGDAIADRLIVAAHSWLSGTTARAALHADRALNGAAAIAGFDRLSPPA